MAADEKKMELLKKLRALAERGVEGEKETAERKLAQLMKKYNIEEEELSDEKLIDYDFRYKTEFEERLLWQLFYKIADNRSRYTYKYGKGSKTTYGITCTKAEGLQIQIEYDFYRELWKEECDFFFRAFIQKHEIFWPTADGGGNQSTLTKEEIMRMIMMMEGMQDKSIHLTLQDGSMEEKED